MKAAFITLFLVVLAGPVFSQESFAPGKTVEKVICASDPAQSYALYLPSAYDPAKKWPILYCYDASAEGVVPLELFRSAAEKYGYIIASSNNSKSDDPTVPNQVFTATLWKDTHERFSIDPQRVYASGFSGGARIACDVGTHNKVAGVIGVGAGFPPDQPPSPQTPFVYFGTIGTRDFNYYEMRAMDRRLQESGVPHRVRSFDGDHEWPPADLCFESIEWMELQAMKKEIRSKDDALVQSWLQSRMSTAGTLETAGKAYDAVTRYEEIIADFTGVADVSAASQKAEQLKATAAYKQEADTWARRDREASEFSLKLASVIRSIRTGSRVPELSTVKAFLGVDALKQKAAGTADIEESLHARRLLRSAQVQCSFYLPRTFLEHGDYAKAALVLSLAVDIKPDLSWSWYYLAAAYAQLGDKQKGLEALAKAVDTGFTDATKMESDYDLKPLREEKEFRKILGRIHH